MRVFILEDSLARLQQFHDAFRHDEVDRGTTLREGYHHFKPPYDLILLDHDLQHEHYKDLQMEIGTGTEFARWLVNRSPAPICPVIVHSFNFFGRRRMIKDLTDAGWECYDSPFGPTMFQLVSRLRERTSTEAPKGDGQG